MTSNVFGPRSVVIMIVIMLLLNSWFPVVVVYVPAFRECKELALSIGAHWNRVLHGMELCWSYVIPAVLTVALDIKVLLVRPPSFGRASTHSNQSKHRVRASSFPKRKSSAVVGLLPQRLKSERQSATTHPPLHSAFFCINAQPMPQISILNEDNQSCKVNPPLISRR